MVLGFQGSSSANLQSPRNLYRRRTSRTIEPLERLEPLEPLEPSYFMPRILVLATTTGYQTRAFGEAAARLGVELVFATDRCHLIEDPWQDGAVPIRFHDEDASVAAILESAAVRPLDGLLVVGDRPTVIGARVAERLGLEWHPVAGAE